MNTSPGSFLAAAFACGLASLAGIAARRPRLHMPRHLMPICIPFPLALSSLPLARARSLCILASAPFLRSVLCRRPRYWRCVLSLRLVRFNRRVQVQGWKWTPRHGTSLASKYAARRLHPPVFTPRWDEERTRTVSLAFCALFVGLDLPGHPIARVCVCVWVSACVKCPCAWCVCTG